MDFSQNAGLYTAFLITTDMDRAAITQIDLDFQRKMENTSLESFTKNYKSTGRKYSGTVATIDPELGRRAGRSSIKLTSKIFKEPEEKDY